jgi:hypothetical protein
MATLEATDTAVLARASPRTQLVCAWSGTAMIVLAGIGLFGSGLFPPMSPQATPQQVAHFYGDDTTLLRVGLVFAFAAFGLCGPFLAEITTQLRRIQNISPVLARTQSMSSAVGWVFLAMPLIFYLAAAFRPDRDPNVLQGMNDLAFLTFLMPFAPFCVLVAATGVAVLQDASREPVFPRWYGYLNLWCVVVFAPAGMMPLFKTGALDWRGLISLWLGFAAFGLWLVASSWTLDRAIRRQALDEANAGGASA